MTFEQWATKRLGPLVMGVNEDEWEKCRDAWNAALSSDSNLTVVYPEHSRSSLAEHFANQQEWADRYYSGQWDWGLPMTAQSV